MTTEMPSKKPGPDLEGKTLTGTGAGSSEPISWPDSSIGSEDALQMVGDQTYSDPIMKAILNSPDSEQLLTNGPTAANSQMLVNHFARNVLRS